MMQSLEGMDLADRIREVAARVAKRLDRVKYHSRRPSPDMPIVDTASVGKRRHKPAGFATDQMIQR